MGRKRRKKRDIQEDQPPKPVNRVAVLCPEPTLHLIREFSKARHGSMRVTADDLIDLGRRSIDFWNDFTALRGDQSMDPAPPLKIAWISPVKKRYLSLWASRDNMDLPLYQSFDDFVQLGAFAWHIIRLSKKGLLASYDRGEVARNLRPDRAFWDSDISAEPKPQNEVD